MNKLKLVLIILILGATFFVAGLMLEDKIFDDRSDLPSGAQSERGGSDPVTDLPASGGGSEEYDFHRLAGNRYSGVLKLFNPVLDADSRRLYVVGSKTTRMAVIDTKKDEIIDSFDMGVAGGFLIFDSKKIYNYNFQGGECHVIDPAKKSVKKAEADDCASRAPKSKGLSQEWKGYSFTETGYQSFSDGTTGFPADWMQDENGAYGAIEIKDGSGRLRGKIIHGPDALYFTIDQAQNKLYTTNTGDGSVSVFDLSRLESTNFCENSACKMKDIDVGTSADQILADSNGRIYLRNRLGGSVIYVYDPGTKKLETIENENQKTGGIGIWPSGMEMSADEKSLYVLSHYSAAIDVVDTRTLQVAGRIQFETGLKPRTDSISDLIIDKTRERLFAVFPELGVIGVADGKNRKVHGMIDLTKYGFSKKLNKGPNKAKLFIDPESNILRVDLAEEKSRLYFDADSLRKLDGQGGFKQPQVKNEATGVVYNIETKIVSPGVSQALVSEMENGTIKKQCVLDKVVSGISPDIEFDFSRNIFYAAYFETAVVKKYEISECSSESSAFLQPSGQKKVPEETKSQAPKGNGAAGMQGKCGDGVCGPVEKEKGVCPEDCN